MITDTAPFRYPHYHEASDTPDKLEYRSLRARGQWAGEDDRGIGQITG